MKRFAFTVGLVAVLWVPALAQVQVDKRRPLPPHSQCTIENAYGSIVVTAWDKDEIWVKGTLAPGAGGLDMESQIEEDDNGDCGHKNKKPCPKRTTISIDVSVPDAWSFDSDDDSDYRSVLEIMVPKSCELQVESVNAPITISGVMGGIAVETVNGNVKVTSSSGELRARTLTGKVDYEGSTSGVEVETVSGAINISGAAGEAQFRSVTGPITVRGRGITELHAETTSGAVQLETTTPGKGDWRVQTFSGAVTLNFPDGASGKFRLRSAEGAITSNIGPKPRREERFNPFRILEFQIGTTEAEIEVETYSGPITLRSGAAKP